MLFLAYAMGCYTDLSCLGVYSGCPWYCHLTYSLVHANLVHLVSCCAVLVLYWVRSIRYMRLGIVLPIVVAVSVSSSILASRDVPTVGMSAVLFAFTGLITAASAIREIARVSVMTVSSAVFTWCFAPAVNTPIHVDAYALALIVGLFIRRYIYRNTI